MNIILTCLLADYECMMALQLEEKILSILCAGNRIPKMTKTCKNIIKKLNISLNQIFGMFSAQLRLYNNNKAQRLHTNTQIYFGIFVL